MQPGQSGVENRHPAEWPYVAYDLSATFAAVRAFPAAVAEVGHLAIGYTPHETPANKWTDSGERGEAC